MKSLLNQGKGGWKVSNNKPGISTRCIIIPICMHGNHWVVVVRRVQEHKEVVFYYADDMNCEWTKEEIKVVFQVQDKDWDFCSPQHMWVVCHNTTYHPHTNECGPGTLIHASLMAIHPAPSLNMLLPMMNPNLAEISRAFVAKIIANQSCHQEVFNEFIVANRGNRPTIIALRGEANNKLLLDIKNLSMDGSRNKTEDRPTNNCTTVNDKPKIIREGRKG